MTKRKVLSLVLIAVIFVTLVLPRESILYAASNVTENIFDISDGNIIISQGTEEGRIKVEVGTTIQKDNIEADQPITIIGTSTMDGVTVSGVTANIILDDVNIANINNNECAFELTGGANVILTLAEGTNNFLKSGRYKAGIRVSDGQKLKISGAGTLEVTGGIEGAGIGGSKNEAGGNITIAGGEIKVTGGLTGAAIGGGWSGNGGNISIEGGNLKAIGGEGGAGIGGGLFKDGGVIHIIGGDVTATGGRAAAGIGSGQNAYGTLIQGGDITIDNPTGKVIATGGTSAAGIGGGTNSSGGSITIKQGTVTATGSSEGAGIGGGQFGTGGDIQILGGEVVATGDISATQYEGGAGIGGGQDGKGGNITINGELAKVIATGGTSAAGIGGGSYESGGNIYLFNGEVTAIGGANAAGIGGGDYTSGGCDNITIQPSVTVRAASNGIKASIDIAGALQVNIQTGVFIGEFSDVQLANTSASVYSIDLNKAPYITRFTPTQDYNSIAFTVPLNNTYRLKIGDALQMSAGNPDCVFTEAGIKVVSNLVTVTESDQGALTDRDALTEDIIKGENIDLSHVISSLAQLPENGANDSEITWKSEDVNILSDDGKSVIRPAYGAGNVEVSLTATIKKGDVTVKKVFSVTILAEPVVPVAPVITTIDLVSGTVNAAYSQTLTATGDSPIAWNLASGALPVGLSLDATTGIISGTPTSVGSSTFTVKASNGVNPEATKELSITIDGDSNITANIFDISKGNIIISQGTEHGRIKVEIGATIQKDNIEADQPITIIGTSTMYGVTVSGVTANIVLDDVNIANINNNECAFELTSGADVTLILKSGTTNILKSGTNKAGLAVPTGQKLKINGTGTLEVKGGIEGAGIGSSKNEAGGNITIAGGKIKTTGGFLGAGIGGGSSGNGGNISIEGGNLEAIGGLSGAGIGGGQFEEGGVISIIGGDVTATGGMVAAGIGSGEASSETPTQGSDITIDNPTGKVIATGGLDAAGIGGGVNSSGGSITIKQGTVIATGSGGGAGIGGCDKITIQPSATVRAASNGTKSAIDIEGASEVDIQTGVFIGKFPSVQSANHSASIYSIDSNKTPYITHFTPTQAYNHIAFTIPLNNTYNLKIVDALQMSAGNPDFVFTEAGIKVVSNLVTVTESDQGALTDRDALTEDSIKGGNTDLSHVISSLAQLPENGENGSAITWKSGDFNVLSDDGKSVIRPAYGAGNVEVSLTATIKKGDVTVKKVFSVTILAEPVVPVAPVITTIDLVSGTVNAAYSQTLTATGDSPIAWSLASGTLPAGLSLDATTGVISGTPTTTGTSTFTVKASNGVNPETTKELSITINAAPVVPVAPVITTATLVSGTVNAAYSQTLTATGDSPIAWSLASGTLPVGLSLDATTGVISGTPTTAGTFNFTVQAANGVGNDTKGLNITIDAVHVVKYTVTFDSIGGNNLAPITDVPSGSTITLPIPTRSSYSFEGWIEGDVQYSNATPITKNVTLIAKWKQNSAGGGGSSSTTTPANTEPAAVVSPVSAEAIKKAEEAIYKLPEAQKQEIFKAMKEELPYTLPEGGLTVEQLKALTHNQLTEAELLTISKKPELLKALGIDTATLAATVVLKPIENIEFKDVASSHWAADTIKEAVKLGIAAGRPDGSFAPSEPLQAADTFTFLDRVLLRHNITVRTLPRSTVEKYITDKDHWAFRNMASIASKLSEDTLKTVSQQGDKPLTRELLAQALYEVTKGKLQAVKEVPTFTDTQSSPYQEAINYCVSIGLLNGTSKNTMSPQKELTRAELMTVLIRLDKLLK